MQWILLILGVILAIVAVFALQNPEVVNIRFLNLSGEASVLVVILIAYVAGVFSGILALTPSWVRKSARLRKLRSEIKTLEKQTAAEPAKAKAEKVEPDQRGFREAEAESARAATPALPSVTQPAAVVEAPVVRTPAESPALEVPVVFASPAGPAHDVSLADQADTAEPNPPSESPAEGGESMSAPVPAPDAESPAGARRGWRRFLDL